MYTTANNSSRLNFEKRVIRTSAKPQQDIHLGRNVTCLKSSGHGFLNASGNYSHIKVNNPSVHCTQGCCLEVLTADPPMLNDGDVTASSCGDRRRCHNGSFCLCKGYDCSAIDDSVVVEGAESNNVVGHRHQQQQQQQQQRSLPSPSSSLRQSLITSFTMTPNNGICTPLGVRGEFSSSSPKKRHADGLKKERSKKFNNNYHNNHNNHENNNINDNNNSFCKGSLRWDEGSLGGVTHSSIRRSQDSETKGPMRVSLAHKALIGKGSFGIVFQAMDRDTNHLIAVKEIPFLSGANNEIVEAVRKELALLKLLDHPHIVKCLGEECDEYSLRIYLEYVSGGSISSVLRTFGSFQEKQASIYTKQMLEGLSYLHDKNIIHRDLKGDNLLVDPNGTLKISDFGTAKSLLDPNKTTGFVGTAYFMAPEVILAQYVGLESDIWSVGCCVIEMLTGKPPFSEVKNQYALMMRVAEIEGELLPHMILKKCKFSNKAMEFLRKCLQRDPLKRPTTRELLKDMWITDPPEDESLICCSFSSESTLTSDEDSNC